MKVEFKKKMLESLVELRYELQKENKLGLVNYILLTPREWNTLKREMEPTACGIPMAHDPDPLVFPPSDRASYERALNKNKGLFTGVFGLKIRPASCSQEKVLAEAGRGCLLKEENKCKSSTARHHHGNFTTWSEGSPFISPHGPTAQDRVDKARADRDKAADKFQNAINTLKRAEKELEKQREFEATINKHIEDHIQKSFGLNRFMWPVWN